MTLTDAALIGAWASILLLLLLLLRVLRLLRAVERANGEAEALRDKEELAVGHPAPGFRCRTLDGLSTGDADFAGTSVVYVFVSPECPICRREMRTLVRLATQAHLTAATQLVLVSDMAETRTEAWFREIRDVDGVTVPLTVLLAPAVSSSLYTTYNPRSATPYYVHVGADGRVVSRDPVGKPSWQALRASWEGREATRRAAINRY